MSEYLEIRRLITALFIVTTSLGYGIETAEDFYNDSFIFTEEESGINVSGIDIINKGSIASSQKIEGSATSVSAITSNNGNIENLGIIEIRSIGAFAAKTGNAIYSTEGIGIVDNYGVISATAIGNKQHYVGNGIYSDRAIGMVNNYGVISGYSDKRVDYSGNGVKAARGSGINNSGIIQGIADNATRMSGNGLFLENSSKKETIANSGVIRGYSPSSPSLTFVGGVGILNNFGYMSHIENLGTISGDTSAIHHSISGNSVNNLGVLTGKKIISGKSSEKYNNYGIEIKLNEDSSGNITEITNGVGGIVDDKTIINGFRYNSLGVVTEIAKEARDSFMLASQLIENVTKLIINGAGMDKGALVVDQDTTLTESIVNGYNTAMYVNDGVKVAAIDTIFNGGGLKNDVAVIKGSEGANEVTLLGNSIINGNVDLGNGDDTLLLANTTQINGVLNGGIGNDTLGLGEKVAIKESDPPNLRIFHNILGFETINTNGNVTLFETVSVKDAANINLESGELTLRVDPTKKDVDGKVIGHALYENAGIINSTGGKLVVGLNGLGENAIVSMGETTISQDINDNWWKDTDNLKTNSLVLDGKLSSDGKDINITVKELIEILPPTVIPPVDPPVDPPTITDNLLYEKLNEVYKSIVSSGELGKLANTTLLEGKTEEEALGGLLVSLDQTYANNPYAYTLKSSRDSLKLFEDNMSYLTIKPDAKEWIVQGKGVYTGVKNDNEASGKNYYGFDTGHRNYKTTTNTVGGIATFEYGLNDKTSAGFVFGGNNQDVNFKGTSSIDANSLYLGTFAKTERNNFKFMGGLGYQYTSADVDRGISNKYDSFKTNDKYDINSLNIFIESKYVLSLKQGYRFEPKVRLSYYNVNQDSINEGYDPNNLSIKVDSQEANTFDIELGADLIRERITDFGKLNTILSFGVIRTLGDMEKDLHGNVLGLDKDGSKFEIKGIELPEVSGKIGYNLELEKQNGMIYTAGANLEFAQEGNRNYNVQVGIGYKF